MDFLAKEILEYSLNFTQKESKLLEELNRETYAKMMMPRMLSGHMQGRFLSMISKMIMPETIIEIGTYTGYSALCLAEGLKKSGQKHICFSTTQSRLSIRGQKLGRTLIKN